jgi:hypothetical protein
MSIEITHLAGHYGCCRLSLDDHESSHSCCDILLGDRMSSMSRFRRQQQLSTGRQRVWSCSNPRFQQATMLAIVLLFVLFHVTNISGGRRDREGVSMRLRPRREKWITKHAQPFVSHSCRSGLYLKGNPTMNSCGVLVSIIGLASGLLGFLCISYLLV